MLSRDERTRRAALVLVSPETAVRWRWRLRRLRRLRPSDILPRNATHANATHATPHFARAGLPNCLNLYLSGRGLKTSAPPHTDKQASYSIV